jgi:hypothetical protein
MKSRGCDDGARRGLDGDVDRRAALQTSVQTSQPMPAHIKELIVSAKTQGHDDAYRRAEGLAIAAACRIA